jgi:hypothetical protein
MDAFSEIPSGVKLSGALFFQQCPLVGNHRFALCLGHKLLFDCEPSGDRVNFTRFRSL